MENVREYYANMRIATGGLQETRVTSRLLVCYILPLFRGLLHVNGVRNIVFRGI